MKIIFIRHGKSVDDTHGISQRNDSPLSDIGVTQAKSRVKDFSHIDFSTCYTSSYRRAQDTARILFPTLPLITQPDIYEVRRPLKLDGGSHADAVRFWEITHKADKYQPDWSYDGSESFTQVSTRARKFISELINIHSSEDDPVAVVSHGGFIRHCIGVACKGKAYDPTDFFDLLLPMKIDNLDAVSLSLGKNEPPSWQWFN